MRQRLDRARGADALDRAATAVGSLEDAVAENRALDVPLEGVVSDLERIVAALIESSDRPGDQPSGGEPPGGEGGVGA